METKRLIMLICMLMCLITFTLGVLAIQLSGWRMFLMVLVGSVALAFMVRGVAFNLDKLENNESNNT